SFGNISPSPTGFARKDGRGTKWSNWRAALVPGCGRRRSIAPLWKHFLKKSGGSIKSPWEKNPPRGTPEETAKHRPSAGRVGFFCPFCPFSGVYIQPESAINLIVTYTTFYIKCIKYRAKTQVGSNGSNAGG